MVSRQLAVSEFFSEAQSMRDALDAQFRDAYKNRLKWHYFCHPEQYTYLRMSSAEAFPAPIFGAFMERLRGWCLETLGLVPMGLPNLHLMIHGCRLGLHSDFHNGVWGYVYSLTRWEERRFSGGETLLLRDGIPSYKRHHVHGGDLYELVPALFNQLLVFDDRLVHATPAIEGSMDPLQGRIALVGHIRATSPIASDGDLAAEVRHVIWDKLEHLRAALANYRDVQGTVTYRIHVGESGAVISVSALTDNLVSPARGYEKSESVSAVRSLLKQAISGLRFKTRSARAEILLPILVPLPDLRPLDVSVPHNSSPAEITNWFCGHRQKFEALGITAEQREDSFFVREPISGEIRIERNEITSSFDPPMWVPSQREQLRQNVLELLQAASGSAISSAHT